MPTPAMVAWVADLMVGNWFRLDYRDRIEPVQSAGKAVAQFSLFVSVQGRGIMFQKHRLASFLQAGLLVPFEEESLTVRATRNALAASTPIHGAVAALRAAVTPGLGVSVDEAASASVDEELVEISASGFAHAPEDHQHDDLQVLERQRSARCGHRPVDRDPRCMCAGSAGRDSRSSGRRSRRCEPVLVRGGVDASTARLHLRLGLGRWSGRRASPALDPLVAPRSRPRSVATGWSCSTESKRQ